MEISEKDIEYLSYMERTDLFYRAMPKDITDETTLIYGQLVQFGKKLYIVNYENWKKRTQNGYSFCDNETSLY